MTTVRTAPRCLQCKSRMVLRKGKYLCTDSKCVKQRIQRQKQRTENAKRQYERQQRLKRNPRRRAKATTSPVALLILGGFAVLIILALMQAR